MKRVFSRSFPVACLLVAGLTMSAMAQSAAAPVVPTGTNKVAVINFEAAVFQTNEGRRDIAAIQQKFEPKRQQLKTQADAINTLKKQLQTDGSKLTAAERQSRTQTIDSKEKTLEQDGETASSAYQQQMEQSYKTIAQKVYGVLQTYAKAHGFGLVLDSSANPQAPPAVLWHTPETDITKAVIDAYNLKSGVAAPAPAVPSAPAPAAHPSGAAH